MKTMVVQIKTNNRIDIKSLDVLVALQSYYPRITFWVRALAPRKPKTKVKS